MRKFLSGVIGICVFLVSTNLMANDSYRSDWLLDPTPFVSEVKYDDIAKELTFTNGLIERRIIIDPEATTISLKNLTTGEEFVRTPAPEARVTIDGDSYPVGGLVGAPVANYWKEEWRSISRPLEKAYTFERYEVGEIEQRFAYKKRPEWLSRDLLWPPKGKRLSLYFKPPIVDSTSDNRKSKLLPQVEVRYEIYDGAPLISKKIVVSCPQDYGDQEFMIDSFVNEELRLVESESVVEFVQPTENFNLCVFSDYSFLGETITNIFDSEAARLKIDADYPTQVNYLRKALCLLECSPKIGPAQIVDKDKPFESTTMYEVLFDETNRERRGLTLRRVMRILAPWTAENPLMFHKVNASLEEVRSGIEQCRETGFEVLIMSFGSEFDLESKDESYRQLYSQLSADAKEVGVALGGYSLTSSRSAANDADNVHNPRPYFGVGPCLQSEWGQDYLQSLKDFMEEADFGVFENDGPYPGDFCEATDHPGHRGKEDSVWTQREAQADLYHWCRARGIYVNQPDRYFLDGGNKSDMGYREDNWSLPRAEQVIIERQNIYDGTWTKAQSLGWMFVPLSQYHGGGAAATIEPLKDHLEHYDARFADLIGAGVQACWRGPRLYDCEETKAVVVKWVNFYKANRRILDGDIIHLRRPTGRDWDGWLHVDPDPNASSRGLAFFYNPTQKTINCEIVVPLYYTGLTEKAKVRIGDSDLNLGEPFDVELNSRCEAILEIEIPAESYSWALFTKTESIHLFN